MGQSPQKLNAFFSECAFDAKTGGGRPPAGSDGVCLGFAKASVAEPCLYCKRVVLTLKTGLGERPSLVDVRDRLVPSDMGWCPMSETLVGVWRQSLRS